MIQARVAPPKGNFVNTDVSFISFPFTSVYVNMQQVRISQATNAGVLYFAVTEHNLRLMLLVSCW